MQKELAHLKMTLLLIKDWDGFQKAMREIMLFGGFPANNKRRTCR